MRRVFVDTNYFAAVLNPRDSLHERAIALGKDLASAGDVQHVTLLATLGELLTYASNQGEAARLEAASVVERVLTSPNFDVLEEDRRLFDAARDLYRRRPDKSYSMIDCMSMIVCREQSITEVLTGDRDFEREGLAILL